MPVTLKDQFDVRGVDSTLGYVVRASSPAQEDAAVVQILKDLGAVILAKTNLPQSIMVGFLPKLPFTEEADILKWCETENPLWGLTTNPLQPDFTPGGSTGGEGALLALKSSMVGWGTDIGGSVRIPAHINGLWGFKPTVSITCVLGNSSSKDSSASRVLDFLIVAFRCQQRGRSMFHPR